MRRADSIQRDYVRRYLRRHAAKLTTPYDAKQFIAMMLDWLRGAARRVNRKKGGLGR